MPQDIVENNKAINQPLIKLRSWTSSGKEAVNGAAQTAPVPGGPGPQPRLCLLQSSVRRVTPCGGRARKNRCHGNDSASH